eukprot:CAMPEP_0184860730 /NCGR_PEP_ID=MMETSP0580-20130426/5561_1 /TAXON_ID=1118495 /ORGANISM="Dactyliosolen fragilissimus" /LENGTH=371 /DNA_ID=CAMNT_0027357943 /DNA_START=135 /DNA_END=1250 /DNA_ORIENTATION=-
MRFTNSSIALMSLIAAPLAVSGFAPSNRAFVPAQVASVASVTSCVSQHVKFCPCPCCQSTALFMADAVTEEAAVPPSVEAIDGVDSTEEAHNVERPSRGSGIHKHKRSNKNRTPIADLEIGSTVEGKIKTTTSYGAFVDIGASTDALLHVSRLSDDFVSNVEDVVKAGDTVSVRIASVDVDKGQIAVSMRSEEAEAAAAESRAAGKRKQRPQRSNGDRQAQIATIQSLSSAGFDDSAFVEGEVVSMLDFGAFVRFDASQLAESVDGELDGLVHISALAEARVSTVDSIVSIGDKVQVRVKYLDAEGNKVSLSMITKEQEEASRPQRDNKPRRRGRQMFSEDEMGAKDWKETLEKMEQPSFSNVAVVVDKRK